MLIKSVELENIKSYAFAMIALGPGVTAILGENGAGKSTILEAVGFALFDHRNGKLSDLLREGAKMGRVAVCLVSSLDGADYLVEREFTAKTTTRYRVHQPEHANQVVAEGVADVQRWLRSHMGVPPDAHLGTLFENTIGVPQGTFTAAFSLPTAPRKEIFNRVLRVDEYEKAAKLLLPTVRQLKDEKVALDTEIARIEGVLTGLPSLREEGVHLASDLRRLGTAEVLRKRQVRKSESDLADLALAAQVVEEARRKAEPARVKLTEQATLAARIEAVRENKQRAEQEQDRACYSVQETEAGVKKAQGVESDIRALQGQSDIDRHNLLTIGKAQAALRAEWMGFKNQNDFLLDAATDECPTCGSELTHESRDNIQARNLKDMALLAREGENQKSLASGLEEQLHKVVSQLHDARRLLRELPSQGDLARAQQDLDRCAKRWDTIKDRLEVLAEPTEDQSSEWERQIAEYETAKAAYDSEEHAKVQAETTRLQLELGGVEAQLKEKRSRLSVVQDSIEALEATEKELAAKTAIATETSDLLATIETVRDILRETGPYVTRRLVRQISQRAAAILADLTGDPRGRLQWTEDYAVFVEHRGYSRTFAKHSGGERMRIALAVRLAMLQEMSAIDVAFLDEPTDSLSERSCENLADSISRIKRFRQLVVITHDNTFGPAAENTIWVVQDERGSHQEEAADD